MARTAPWRPRTAADIAPKPIKLRHYAARIIPPRELENVIETAAALFGGVGNEVGVFDLVIESDAPSWWVRAPTKAGLERLVRRLRNTWPDATVEIAERFSPAVIHDFEQYVRIPLISSDPAAVLRGGWRDVLTRQEADPLANVLAEAAPPPGTRLVAELRVRLAPDAERAAIRARRRDVMEERDLRQEQLRQAQAATRPAGPPSNAPPLPLLLTAMVLLLGGSALWGLIQTGVPLPWGGRLDLLALGRWWIAAGPLQLLATLGLVLFLGAGAGGVMLLWLRVRKRLRALLPLLPGRALPPLEPEDVEEKLSTTLLESSLVVYGVASPRAPAAPLREETLRFAQSYQEFAGGSANSELVARTRKGGTRPQHERDIPADARRLLNAREGAALWHLPFRLGAAAGVERGRARRLTPERGHAQEGILVGYSDSEAGREIRQPFNLAHRNQLIVAKTRRGKSTLLRWIASGLMSEGGTQGEPPPVLVVVDPHQDLAEAVLETVPPALAGRTTYLDFSNLDRPIGLNLLDVRLFPDRDRQVANVLSMMNNLWRDAWGPRMEGPFRNALLALHTVNHSRPPHAQYTLLDISALLMDAGFRQRILNLAQDPALSVWFRDNYERTSESLRLMSANPVTTKIGRFISTEAARLVFGQSRSSINPARVVREGGVLVVNTATGLLGEGAASLLGATLINLIALSVEAQVALPPSQRRRVVMLIDESSTLGAIDYTRILSEFGKYGLSSILVTQALAKFDAIDPVLRPTILSNIDALTVFQSSAEDARALRDELGPEIGVEDVVSLDDFTAYARWWDGSSKPPVFSMRVRPPPGGVDSQAGTRRRELIAARSAERYGRPRAEVALALERMLESHLQRGAQRSGPASAGQARAQVADRVQPQSRRAGQGAPPPNPSEVGRTRGGRGRGRRPVNRDLPLTPPIQDVRAIEPTDGDPPPTPDPRQ